MGLAEHPSPELIEAVAFGRDISPDFRRHIDECPECSAQLAQFRANNEFLADLLVAVSPKRAAEAERPSESVPGYRILEPISAGGQGMVYKAVQERTGRIVALKMLGGGWFATEKQRRRFEREIDIAASLRHPNIATVYDAVELRTGLHAFAMEYIEGVPLDRWEPPGIAAIGSDRGASRPDIPPHLRFAPETVRAKLRVFAKVCDAVHYAHQKGIIHRDLKPSNILADIAGEPHVLDFGIAVFAGESDGARVTQSGEFTGTVEFASPEQAGGEPTGIDFRTDIYSLGVILYASLTGALPYAMQGHTLDKLRAIQQEPPRRPGLVHPSLRGDIETIILKALDKDRARRYQTAAELGADVRHFLANEPVQARRDSIVYVLGKRASRHRGKLAAAGLLLVAGGVGLGFYLHERSLWTQREAEAKSALLMKDAQTSRELARKERESIARMGAIIGGAMGAGGRTLSDAEVQRMKETAARLERTISDARADLSPTANAEMRLVLAGIYRDAGLFPDAAFQLTAVDGIAGVLDDGPGSALRNRASAIRATLDAPPPPAGDDGPALLTRVSEHLARDESEAAIRTAGLAAAAFRSAKPPDEAGALLAEVMGARAILRAGRAEDAEHAATAAVESLAGLKEGAGRPTVAAWTTVAEARLARGDQVGVWQALARALAGLAAQKDLPPGVSEALAPLAGFPIDDPREEVRGPARRQGPQIATSTIGLLRAWELRHSLDIAERLFEIAGGVGAAFDSSLAAPFVEAGLSVYEEELPKNDPRVVDAMWRAGRVLTEAGDPESGVRAMQAARERDPDSLGGQFVADHFTRLSVLCGAYAMLDRWTEIAQARGADVERRAKPPGEDPLVLAGARLALARACIYSGELDGAARQLTQIDAALEKSSGDAGAACLARRASHERAHLLAKQGRSEEAMTVIKNGKGSCAGDPAAAAYEPGLRAIEGVVFAAGAKYDEADRAFNESLPLLMTAREPATCRPLVRDAAAMYEAWGRKERAKELRDWLAEGSAP